MFGLRDPFEYFTCAECGCLQISAIPDDLSKYYPAGYYSFAAVDLPRSTGLKHRLKNLRSRSYLGRGSATGSLLRAIFGLPELPSWVEEVGIGPGAKILDVGCGAGLLLAQLQAEGFSRVTGLDPYIPEDHSSDAPIRIFKRELADLGEDFDLIMLHHSFEHMADPLQTLRDLRDRTRPGGTVLIRIPVVPSHAWDEYGTDWVQLDAPRHLHLHSLKSMDLAAEQTGFEIASVRFDSYALQFWGSEQYRRGIPLRDPRSVASGIEDSHFSEAEIAEFEHASLELNESGRGDQACFILRRQPH